MACQRPLAAKSAGIATIEFALTAMLLLIVAGGLVEFGRVLWAYDALARSTRDAARLLAGTPLTQLQATLPQATTMVTDSANAAGIPGFSAANVTVTCSPLACAGATQPGDITRISVSVHLDWGIGGVIAFPFSSTGGKGWSVTLAPATTLPFLW